MLPSSRDLLPARLLALVVVLFLGSAAYSASAQAPQPWSANDVTELTLNLGEQQVLPAQGVKSYSEGVRNVIDVRLTGDASRFVVVGLAPGSTSLLFLMNDGSERHYRITVVDPGGTATGAQQQKVDPLAVAPQANIRLDLYFVQVDRSYSHDIGVNMPTTIGTGTFLYAYDIPTRSLVSNSAIVGTEFLPQLELAQSDGWAKLNKHVAVITSNGTTANFDSGGEFNVQVVQGNNATLATIRFGSVLGVKPRYDEETGRIELGIEAEVADLSATGAAIPGRNRSILTTVVNLALGESLAVAGLSSETRESTMSGLPGLSQIPILGFLFGRNAARSRDIENIVFIVPSVVEPMQRARGKEFLREALIQYDNFDGDMDEVQKPMLLELEKTEQKAPPARPPVSVVPQPESRPTSAGGSGATARRR
jgi:pilus assembly protein CpaC